MEGVGPTVRADLPFLSEDGNDVVVLVDVHEPFEDILEHAARAAFGNASRIECRGFNRHRFAKDGR